MTMIFSPFPLNYAVIVNSSMMSMMMTKTCYSKLVASAFPHHAFFQMEKPMGIHPLKMAILLKKKNFRRTKGYLSQWHVDSSITIEIITLLISFTPGIVIFIFIRHDLIGNDSSNLRIFFFKNLRKI